MSSWLAFSIDVMGGSWTTLATAELTFDAVAVANSFALGRSSASLRRKASYSPSVTKILVVGWRHSWPCS